MNIWVVQVTTADDPPRCAPPLLTFKTREAMFVFLMDKITEDGCCVETARASIEDALEDEEGAITIDDHRYHMEETEPIDNECIECFCFECQDWGSCTG